MAARTTAGGIPSIRIDIAAGQGCDQSGSTCSLDIWTGDLVSHHISIGFLTMKRKSNSIVLELAMMWFCHILSFAVMNMEIHFKIDEESWPLIGDGTADDGACVQQPPGILSFSWRMGKS
ncbi:hypothetical protein U9M48_026130 [Paspalum notatum var. saurae]|uniref:Uncharacterized protein n=1 Tax=Paspalum notatum var. saurae TaxID=547442 RepID=A0AAQ3WY17_PASNO